MSIRDQRTKNIDPPIGRESYYEYRDRWAVLVGISRYKHSSKENPLDLQYARRDAEELAKLFRQTAYGGIDESRMRLLCDEEATTAAIIKALRSFLKKPARQDLVLLHFSCHGAPDPDGLDEMYLVTHDTDPSDVPATALPMREVRYALDHTLKAERVVILADTCYASALAGAGRRSATPTAGVMKSYLDEIGKSKPGRAWLMSAEANEKSIEKEFPPDGGHGLFTYHVIQGLKGKAGEKGLVRVGELFDYVEKEVEKSSDHKQHPSKGVEGFDRNLVLAVTAHLEAEEHYQIGRLLIKMGLLLDDPRRFEEATWQFEQASSLARQNALALPGALFHHGLARLLMGDGQGAIDSLNEAVSLSIEGDAPELEVAADARFLRPLALLDAGQPLDEALTSLDEFLEKHTKDPRADSAREMISRIERANRSRRRALLICIGEYQSPRIPSLPGPANDAKALGGLLIHRLGFLAEDVRTLADSEATRDGILTALAALKAQTGPDDIVIVYFGGHGLQGKSEEYWVTHDTSSEVAESGKGFKNALTAVEIHEAIKDIPSSKTIALIDTHPNDNYLELIRRDPSYAMILGASPGEQAYEIKWESSTGMEPHGTFTCGLLRAMSDVNPTELTARLLFDRAVEELRRLGYQPAASDQTGLTKSGQKQTPLMILEYGTEDQVLFRGLIDFPALYRFGQRSSYGSISFDRVESIARRYRSLSAPFAQLKPSLGRAYLGLGRYDEAIGTIDPAAAQEPVDGDALTLACAYLMGGRDDDARKTLGSSIVARRERANEVEREALAELESLFAKGVGRRHALLVGINAYVATEVPSPRGAVADVDALAAVLIERWKFRTEDVTVLTDGAATREAILAGFRNLVGLAPKTPRLFVFSGVGSSDAEDRLTLVAVDSRLLPDVFDDIDLAELQGTAKGAVDDLITILDAGWAECPAGPDEAAMSKGRYAPVNRRHRSMTRDLKMSDLDRDLEKVELPIGMLTIYDSSLRVVWSDSFPVVEDERPDPDPGSQAEPKVYGLLCHALTKALWRLDPELATAQDWIDSASESWIDRANPLQRSKPVIESRSSEMAKPIFGPPPWRAIVEALTRTERAPLAELVPRLQRLIDKQDRPENYLSLGLAQELAGRCDDAAIAFQQAGDHDDAGPRIRAEAKYHLGRVLYESRKGEQLDRAISELKDATEQDKELGAAFYYLGHALRESARRNLMNLSVKAFQSYLEAGAPLGHRIEVQRLMTQVPRATNTTPAAIA